METKNEKSSDAIVIGRRDVKKTPDIGFHVVLSVILSGIIIGSLILFADNYYIFNIEKESYTIRREMLVLRQKIQYLEHQLKEKNHQIQILTERVGDQIRAEER